MKKYIVTFLIISIISASCKKVEPNQSIDEGNVKESTYTSEEIGWTIEIPAKWEIVGKEEKESLQEKGKEALSGAIGEDIDYSGLKNLIAFKKNQFNIFQSTSEVFSNDEGIEWDEHNQALKELVYITYQDQGIKVDTSSTSIEKIDGIDFKNYTFTIYSPKGEVIVRQIVYSRLINNFDFCVNINYNDDNYRDEMLRAFRNSKFKQ